MKRLKNLPQSLTASLPFHPLVLISWLEQLSVWVVALGVDWTKLPWAFAGATIATLKSKKDASGQPIHKPFWEWAAIAISGTVIAMAGWKDVMKKVDLSPELSTVIAGLIAWVLADFIIKKGTKFLSDDDSIKLKP